MSSRKRDTPEAVRAKLLWELSDHAPDAEFNSGGVKHGWRRSPTYETWANLRRRAARGDISLCDRWSVFSNFVEDMGPKPDKATIHHNGNDEPYSPSSCIWIGRTNYAAR